MSKIKEDSFKVLMNYAFKRCDVLTFCLRNYGYYRMTEKNREFFEVPIFTEEEKKKPGAIEALEERFKFMEFVNSDKNIKENQYYLDYINIVQDFLSKFTSNIIKVFESVGYFNSAEVTVSDIYIVKLDQRVAEIILETGSLFNWLPPNYPEDVCFFSKGKIWLESIAHEQELYLYPEDEEEYKHLEKLGLAEFVHYSYFNKKALNLVKLKYTISYDE